MHDVRISSPTKVLFPDDGITKADLAEHYARVADRMLPHVVDRPLSLQVYPGGIAKKGHFLKEIPGYFPDWVARAELPKHGGTVTHIVPKHADTLQQIAQHNAITPHVPTARIDSPDKPDRMIVDFDPADDNPRWSDIQAAAKLAAEILRGAGLEPFVMTSGSRGLHVTVPIRRESVYPDVLKMARALAEQCVDAMPDALTLKFKKEQRDDRIYVDVLRNRKAHTAVAPWAVRAKDGAPVATPITWDEVDDVTPTRYTLRDMRVGGTESDPWADFAAAAVSPRSAAKRLG
jgi:bifunctional non-homologous end joining protein LigD